MPGQYTGNRGQAQEYLSGLIREGLTNSEIVDFLRGEGLSYRLQNMYADVNRTRLEQFGAEGIKKLDISTPVPERLMRDWEGDVSFKYRVVVQYEYTPSGGGESVKAGTTLYYDTRPSMQDVLEDWDVRVKTLEGGFGSTTDIMQIEQVTEINYFVNKVKG